MDRLIVQLGSLHASETQLAALEAAVAHLDASTAALERSAGLVAA